MKIGLFRGYRRCNNTVMWEIQKKQVFEGKVEKNHLKKGKHLFFHLAVPVNPAVTKALCQQKFNVGIVFLPDPEYITERGYLIIFIMYP